MIISSKTAKATTYLCRDVSSQAYFIQETLNAFFRFSFNYHRIFEKSRSSTISYDTATNYSFLSK